MASLSKYSVRDSALALQILALIASYYLTGKLGTSLAIPPGYATAIWPPSGIALAGILMFGYRVWPGILLGSFLVNLPTTLGAGSTPETLLSVIVTLAIGSGAALQAVVGGYLLRRFADFPNPLSNEKDVFLFLLVGGVLGSLVNSTISVSTLVIADRIPWVNFPANWGTWWMGDALGVFIFTPLVLVWGQQTREFWRNRRMAITLPIMVMFVLTTVAVFHEAKNNSERLKLEFDQHALELKVALDTSISNHINALYALESFYSASKTIDREGFGIFVTRLLDNLPGIQALGWNPIVPSAERNAFERKVRSEGYRNFQITEQNADKQMVAAENRPVYVPVDFIEPYKGNEVALGFDVYSDRLRHEAIDRAKDTGEITTTSQITLVQELGHQNGVLTLMPVYRSGLPHKTLEERRLNIAGYMVAVFRGKDIVTAALKDINRERLSYRLIDESAPAAEQLIFSSDRKELKALSLQEKGLFGRNLSLISRSAITVGGRQWRFEVTPTQEYLAAHREDNAWLILLSGLMLTSIVGAFAMVSSGRGSHLRRLVEERTAALAESEGRFRSTFESAPVGVANVSLDGHFIEVNQGYCDLVGYSRDELLGMTVKQVTPPDYHQSDADMINKALSGEIHGFNREKQYVRKDGELVWGNLSAKLIRHADGSPDHFVAVIENIDSRKRAELSLQKESEKNLALLRNASDGIHILDSDGNIIEVSDSFCAMLGYRRDEMIGMNVAQWDGNHSEAECLQLIRQQLATQRRALFETRHRRKDGSLIDVEVSGSPLELDGKPVLFNSSRDITARKAAEDLLRKLSLAVEQSPNSIVITDLGANIEYVNQAFVNTTGYQRDEVIGKNPSLLHSGKTPKATHDDMWATLINGRAWKGELINKRKNGSEYIESAWISPVHQSDGKVTHYVGIKEDITARKQAQLLLQESEQRFRAVADAAPVMIWLAGIDKLCTWFNQVWLNFTGRSMEQECGNGWADSVHPDDLERCLDIYVNYFDRREPFRMEYRLKRNDGEYRWIDDHGVPLFGADGTFAGYIGSCLDITDMRQAQNQLQASHDLFTELFRQVPGVVYQFRLFPDGHYSFPFASDSIRDIYEVTPEQVSEDAAPVFAVMHPDDYERIVASVQESARTLQPWQLEYRVNLPKKGVRWLSGLSKPEKLEDGSTLWHGFITDITEQIVARNEASKTKEALESVLSSATEISIIVTDPDGIIRMFNRGAERMLGYSSDEMVGKQSLAIIHEPEEAEQRGRELTQELGRPVSGFKIFVEKAIQSGQETREWTYVRKDRSTLTVSLVLTVIRNRNDEITGFLGIAEDITKRKQAQDERNLLLKIIEESPDFISTADMQSHLKYLNAAGARLVGLPDDVDLSALSIKDMHPEWAARRVLAEGIPAVLRQGFWQGETALQHRDGREIPVSQLLLLHRDASGNPLLLSTIMRDITVYKQAEQALRQAKEAAEGLAQSKSEFLANMSHEIRTPMNAIIGLSHLALNKEISAEIRDYLEKIYSSSNSLLGILNDVLDFSKLEAGRLTIDHSHFNIDVMLDNIRNMFVERAKEKHIGFKMDVAPDVPRDLVGDGLRLQQVLINLLGNAIKFTERGEVVFKITVSQTDQSQVRLLFCVTDTGIGMSAHDLDKLFQPFSQVDGSITRRFGGTGLGLAISHNLLQLMGGKFSVESSPGKGSCFSFELPLDVSPLSSRHRPEATSIPIEEDLDKVLIGVRILVAEDNLINQQVVREFLNLSGISVEMANNGKEAIALLENEAFDAVLMDIHMPEMDGFAATKLIRSQARFAGLPVIALTAGVTKEERERCKAAGMNDFIAKPISPKRLLSTLVKWIKPIGSMVRDAFAVEPVAETRLSVDELPDFDLHNLLEMLGNNRELATQLLLGFMDSMKDLPDEIEAMIRASDFAEAGELVHKIKGASGNIGAVRLHVASEALEAELKQGQAAALSLFREAFNQAMSVIAALPLLEAQMPSSSGDIDALKLAAAELDVLLKENDFISEVLLNTLKPHLRPDQLDLFAQLRKLVNDLQYGEARKVLRQLAELPDTSG
ncbi:MAG: PAS domain S-box protein [Methylobacter sp.]|nr:MAG: PAS domain S-box protein [Methylobacter sp.]